MNFSKYSSAWIWALVLIFQTAAAAQDTPVRTATIGATVTGPQTVVNASALYIDGIFSRTLSSLELIAATSEARSRDWVGVRGYLERIAPQLGAIYFYVLPDGSFHTLDGGRSSQNLSERAYFKPLFAGEQVRGFPLQSLTTGRKIAMLATPVVVDGTVVAAVGASVFLDTLRTRLNRELDLPANYTWFVLDAHGNTLLDRDADFILMNVFEQGSASMQQAVRQAMQYDSGVARYSLDGSREAHFRKLPNLDWWMYLAQTGDSTTEVPPQLHASLAELAARLKADLDAVDNALASAIGAHTPGDDSEAGLRALLATVVGATAQIANAAYIDTAGTLRYITPVAYAEAEGADIRAQAHVKTMLARPAPLLGKAFDAVEGGLAVNVMRPITDGNQGFTGAISALVRPARLAGNLLESVSLAEGQELWIMQPDGLILYDDDADEIGRNLFSDPLYSGHESLLALGRRIAEVPDGEGGYVFAARGSQTPVIKNAAWTTVRLHGSEWRIVLAYRPFEGNQGVFTVTP